MQIKHFIDFFKIPFYFLPDGNSGGRPCAPPLRAPPSAGLVGAV